MSLRVAAKSSHAISTLARGAPCPTATPDAKGAGGLPYAEPHLAARPDSCGRNTGHLSLRSICTWCFGCPQGGCGSQHVIRCQPSFLHVKQVVVQAEPRCDGAWVRLRVGRISNILLDMGYHKKSLGNFIMRNISLSYLLLSLSVVNPIWADSNIAVPDFELLDLTLKLSDPKKVAEIDAQEQKKVELIETLLRDGITNTASYTLIPISNEARNEADKGVGYLFDCSSCSAELGRNHDADYILIGRLHKPSYLFSYIIVRVIDTQTDKLIEEFRIEVKGKPSKSIPGAIDNLLIKINETIPQ